MGKGFTGNRLLNEMEKLKNYTLENQFKEKLNKGFEEKEAKELDLLFKMVSELG